MRQGPVATEQAKRFKVRPEGHSVSLVEKEKIGFARCKTTVFAMRGQIRLGLFHSAFDSHGIDEAEDAKARQLGYIARILSAAVIYPTDADGSRKVDA